MRGVRGFESHTKVRSKDRREFSARCKAEPHSQKLTPEINIGTSCLTTLCSNSQ